MVFVVEFHAINKYYKEYQMIRNLLSNIQYENDQQINIYEKRAQVDVLERLLKYKTLGLGIINTRRIINIELYRIRAEIRKEESKKTRYRRPFFFFFPNPQKL